MGGAFSRANANFNPNVNPNKPDVAPFTTCQDLIPVLEKGMGVFENNANCDRAVRLAATQVNAVTSDPPRPECSQPTSFTFINNFGSGQINNIEIDLKKLSEQNNQILFQNKKVLDLLKDKKLNEEKESIEN